MNQYVVTLTLIAFIMVGSTAYAVYEKEPIKRTKSDAVAVTKELLEREGDVGPATPTIKMADTSVFLTEKPHHAPTDDDEDQVSEEEPWWERWFFWMEDEEGSES